jgi:hypothetical protein
MQTYKLTNFVLPVRLVFGLVATLLNYQSESTSPEASTKREQGLHVFRGTRGFLMANAYLVNVIVS